MGIRHGGRQQIIDEEMILSAALDLGMDRLSMNAVAKRLGVSAAALYRYVPSREALLELCLDAFANKLDFSPQGTWRETLAALAEAFRAALKASPGAAAHAFKLGPGSPRGMRLMDSVLGALIDAGFTPKLAWQAYSAVVDHAVTSVQKEELAGRPRAVQHYLAEHSGEFAHLSAALAEVLPPDFDQAFAARLEFLLSGIAAAHQRILEDS